MVELAMVTPLLIILLAGLVEIGWFANNYLNLLDVSRSGARRATVLVDNLSPLSDAWLPEYSYVPHSMLTRPQDVPYRMPYIPATTDSDTTRSEYRWLPSNSVTACDTSITDRLFYNEIICTMQISMNPLTWDPTNYIDDVIITPYSVEMVDVWYSPTVHHSGLLPAYPQRPVSGDIPQMVVAGRYPTNANECDVTETSPGVYALTPRDFRDPFDMNNNAKRDDNSTANVIDGDNDFEEIEGYDAPVTPTGNLAADIANSERQVGYSLFGNHKIPNSLCVGSEWTIREIEDIMNLPLYNITDNFARARMPGQGMVMVEMYWQHEMLLQIPVLSPVFEAVGNSDGKMIIYVWSAFPLPAAEPYIIFPA